ncbi:rod shape-determining protein [Streptacidiphilus sp. MAP5-3]|uniref:rod shape-determining protein n=1 Tax=unclassified Streptacidiphilus TaxID=2643834 RepID=UPI003517EE46
MHVNRLVTDRLVTDRLIALDLGTSRVRAWRSRGGVVFDEPSVVAFDLDRGIAFAFGEPAQRMTGRTPPGMTTVSPLSAGTITDFEGARVLARLALDQARASRFSLRPTVATAVTVESRGIHVKALEQALLQAGAAKALTFPAPLAAAVGAGLPIDQETGTMVVDLGAGTSDLAVFAFGQLVSATSLTVGGNTFDRALAAWARRHHRVDLGPTAAEQLRIAAGSWDGDPSARVLEAKGRRTEFGTPLLATFSAEDVHRAISPAVDVLVDGMGALLARCPTELSADITQHGIVLTGGCARDAWLSTLLRDRLDLDVRVADSPESCTVRGLGRLAGAVGTTRQGGDGTTALRAIAAAVGD